ncbi:MAG: endonuclease/exonuclease/phosphatase family protein [Pirellulaceae bacterium]
MTKIRIATWNLQWAKPDSDRGQACEQLLQDLNIDVLCLTEAHEGSADFLGEHTAVSEANTGYPIQPGRRKVVIASHLPLSNIDQFGTERLPSGRFVSASVDSDVKLNLVGVCIPWRDAHVNSGRRNREQWEDHLGYLSSLNEMLQHSTDEVPTIVFGDFNQRISGKYVRTDAHELLTDTFKAFQIPTAQLCDVDGKTAIDHIAIRGNTNIVESGVVSRFDLNNTELSDHFGVWCDVELD